MKKKFGVVLAFFICGVLICLQAVEENRGVTLIKKNSTFNKYAIPFENQWALIIGIDKYKYIRKLNNAVFDVQTIRDILINNYGYRKRNIEELYDSEATWKNIYTKLRTVSKKMTDKDSLLIYFGGHGYLDRDLGEGYWLPIDCGKDNSHSHEGLIDENKINNTPFRIHNAHIHALMEKCNAKHIFVIADSCYSGEFLDLNRDTAGNLSSYFYKKSRHVLASGRGIVSDGPKGKHSPFARVLIDFLKNNSEQDIFASQLIAYVKKIVEREHSQRPFGGAVRGVHDEDGEFIFFLKDDVYLHQIKAEYNNLQKAMKSGSLSVSDKLKQCSNFQDKYRGEPFQRLSKEFKEVKDILSRVEGLKRELEKKYKDVALNKGSEEGGLLFKKGENKIITFKKHGLALQSTLQYLDRTEDVKSATLHYLVSEDQVSVILTTSTSQLVKTSKINIKKLNRMIIKYREEIRGRGVTFSKASVRHNISKNLYDVIFKPVDEELKKNGVNNLMVFFEGVLKYISLGALWNGGSYLVQRYRITLLTTSSLTRIEREPTEKMKILCLGASGGGNGFSPLPYVKDEIRSIVKNEEQGYYGLIKGRGLIDDDFTKDTMLEQLNNNDYTIVHISSHFMFNPGDEEKNYLLMGDRSILKLSELRAQKNVFGGVEMIVLASCETGVGGGSVQEIDGFAELVQQLGAQSVIAALWKVTDKSTKDLMVNFYRKLKEKKVTSKIEALRQAQLNLAGLQDLLGKDEANHQVRKKTKYPHPFFWGSFIMIGNWR